MEKKKTGISASALYKNSNRNSLDQIITGIIRQLDAKIYTAHNSGESSVTYDLPTVFDIMGLSKQDSQLIVYSDLVRIYGTPEPNGKGFNVSFTMTPPKITISWTNGVTTTERSERESILKRCM